MKLSVMDGGKSTFKEVAISDVNDLTNVIQMHTYSLGKFKGGHRTNENFQCAEFIGLDFDDGLSIEDAVEIFKNHWHIIATTQNHQKEKNGIVADRFRVILKPEKEITTKEDYKNTVLNLMKKYPQADKACSDAARMFFPSTDIVSTNSEGSVIPVLEYTPEVKEKTEVSSYMKGQLARKTYDFITFGTKVDWNHRLFQAAVDCNEQQYTMEETIELLRPATRYFDGDFDANDLKTIKSAFDREPKHAPRNVESVFNFKHPTELSESKEELDWLIDGLAIKGGLSIFAGPAKCGKSTLTRQLAIAVTRGGEWLKRKVQKGKVIYLALEEQEDMLSFQLKRLGLNEKDEILMHVGEPNGIAVKDSLEQAIESYGADLVIVDTMLLLAKFNDLNNYSEVYNKLTEYRNLARSTGAHIMMIHHVNKSNEGMNAIMGSNALQGAVDCMMLLSAIPGRGGFRKFESKQRGGRAFIDSELKYIEEHDIYELNGKLGF